MNIRYTLLFLLLFTNLYLIDAQNNINYLKGVSFEYKKLPDSALFYLNMALDTEKPTNSIVLHRANVLYSTNQYQQAIADYEKLNTLQPDMGNLGLARCYAQQNDTIKAFKYLQKHLESRYKLPQSELKLDKAFLPYENTLPWTNLWNKEWYNKYDEQMRDAAFMYKNENYTEVVEFVSNIVKSGSSKDELLAIRGKAFYQLQSYPSTIADLTAAIKANKRNAEYYKYRAQAYMQLTDYKEAISDYTTALNIDPTLFSIYHKRAEAYYCYKNYDAAMTDIDFYLQFIENKDATMLSSKIAYEQGNYVTALERIHKIIKQDNEQAKYYQQRARIYEKLKLYPYCEKDYSRALETAKTDTSMLFHRALVRLMLNNRAGACADFKQANKLGHPKAYDFQMKYCK